MRGEVHFYTLFNAIIFDSLEHAEGDLVVRGMELWACCSLCLETIGYYLVSIP